MPKPSRVALLFGLICLLALLVVDRLFRGMLAGADIELLLLAEGALVAAVSASLVYLVLSHEARLSVKTHRNERRLEQRLRAMFDQHSAIQLVIDPATGRILDANPAALAFYGYGRDEIADLTIADINILPRETIEAQIKAAQAGERTSFRFPHRLKSGEVRNVEVFSAEVRDGDRPLLYSIIHDVSEKVRAEAELLIAKQRAETANQAKSDFLAAMSHELRTPLNAINGFSEMMENQVFGPLGNQRYIEYSQDIHASGQHLLALINEVLDLSRIEVGRMELHAEPCDLVTISDDVLRLLRPRATAAGLSLESRLADGLPGLEADRRMVIRLLTNLLVNAIKFTRPGGRIVLAVQLRPDGLAIIVTDTGIGMSEDEVRTAREPFCRIDNAYTRNAEGTGLGLALCDRIMMLHGGGLVIESEPDQGTTVSALFPSERLVTLTADQSSPDWTDAREERISVPC